MPSNFIYLTLLHPDAFRRDRGSIVQLAAHSELLRFATDFLPGKVDRDTDCAGSLYKPRRCKYRMLASNLAEL